MANTIYLAATVVQCAAMFSGGPHVHAIGVSSIIYGAAVVGAALYRRFLT